MNFLANRICVASLVAQLVLGSDFQEFLNATCVKNRINSSANENGSLSDCEKSCDENTNCVGFEWKTASGSAGTCKLGASLRSVDYDKSQTRSCYVKKSSGGNRKYLTTFGWRCAGQLLFKGYPVDGKLDSGSNWKNINLPAPSAVKDKITTGGSWSQPNKAIKEVATGDPDIVQGECAKLCDALPDCVAYTINGLSKKFWAEAKEGDRANNRNSYKCDFYAHSKNPFHMRKTSKNKPRYCAVRVAQALPVYSQFGEPAETACPLTGKNGKVDWGKVVLFKFTGQSTGGRAQCPTETSRVCPLPADCVLICDDLGSLCSGFAHTKKSNDPDVHGLCTFFGASYNFPSGAIEFDRTDIADESNYRKCFQKGN